MIATGVITFFVLVLGGAAVWAASYDRSTSGKLLPDTRIQGVAVGGMKKAEAIRLLRQELETPLRRPIQLKAGDVQVPTTAWDLGYRVDVAAAVDKALGNAGGNLPARLWKRLFTRPQQFVLAEPKWHEGTFEQVMADTAKAITHPPEDARLESSNGWVQVVRDKPGRELDFDGSRDAVKAGVELKDEVIPLSIRDVPATVTRDQFRKVILIRTGENKLYLYENGSIAKSWPVATGASGFPTPTGNWKIVEKIENPTWINPGSDWARGMPAQIGPGPNNPLGTRALALDAPAILIHATSDRASIGYGASHGCVRMTEEHELELFNRVDAGTPVIIVKAGEPPPRGTVVLPNDSAQAAAVQF